MVFSSFTEVQLVVTLNTLQVESQQRFVGISANVKKENTSRCQRKTTFGFFITHKQILVQGSQQLWKLGKLRE